MTITRTSARLPSMARNRSEPDRRTAKAIGYARVGAPVRHRGMALPSALMLASAMLTTSAVWLEASIAHRRYAANIYEHLRATQAADGALALCADDLRAGVAPVLPALGDGSARWAKTEAFDHFAAYEPVPLWPGSARAPQCLVEAVSMEDEPAPAPEPGTRAYWITARGFGSVESTQAWRQLTIVREAGSERRVWRRIVTASTGS
ncbi:pilus assembly PilX family protein [Trinickia acidisoli]|uniref:pilus assembly PilX family protein n=1 Tax=Trinickia acidisoli TaxID=2767482 RepID=UPI001A8ECB77|nr:hypothetical protein [Trinickia acidisoli]